MFSQIGLIHLFLCPILPQGSCRIFIFVFSSLPKQYKQAITSFATNHSFLGGGVEPPTKFSRRGLDRISILEGVAEKK